MTKANRHMAMLMCMLIATFGAISCRIQPPLHLPGQELDVVLPEVLTDIEVVWNIDADWKSNWFYGWDDDDRTIWGDLNYPEPSSYEVRIYYYGSERKGTSAPQWDPMSIFGSKFRRRFNFGWHDLLMWSDVVTYDGTQAVIIDETNPYEIHATTSKANLSFAMPGSRSTAVHNNPEIFYSGLEEDFQLTENTADYDYFDENRGVWVKELHTQVYPMVYIYLVQVIIYNNNGRIIGLADKAAMTSMADGLNLHTGSTHENDIVVAFAMRMKKDKDTDVGNADILGTKFTTYGLCGMDSWSKSRGSKYAGSRGQLRNHLSLDFAFHNATDSAYSFDVTEQMQAQSHGGVVTIKIDADTIHIPVLPQEGGGSGFKPTVEVQDTIVHEFPM